MTSLWWASRAGPRPISELQPAHSYDTVVVGAGITGLSTAVLLARAGQSVGVLEAHAVGALATGHTTAKLSLLQGTVLSQIRRHHSDAQLQAYVQASSQAQDWLLRFLQHSSVEHQRRDAYTYATTHDGEEALRAELAACTTTGIPADWTADTELPFPITGALRLDNQVQFHPLDLLDELAGDLHQNGGQIVEGVRVTGVSHSSPATVSTNLGSVTADKVVLATGYPILDRGGHFATLQAQRSYAISVKLPQPPAVQGMYLTADSPMRSLRTARHDGEEILLVGGNSHPVGQDGSHQGAVDDLTDWARHHFPGAERLHQWSAQDYRHADRLPHYGRLPRGAGHLHYATGFNKWGMSNGVAAAQAIASEILGEPAARAPGRADTPRASTVLTGLKDNAAVGKGAVSGWAGAELNALPEAPPREGQGLLGRRSGRPVAVSTVDGVTCELSAVCPHMGGIVTWNNAERSWDCPLHASRFAPDGSRLEGPALKDLRNYP